MSWTHFFFGGGGIESATGRLWHMELDKVIKNVVKDMKANRPVEQIAKRNEIEVRLVEDILQIYTTHPGIDLDGILDRLSYYGY